MDVEVFFRAAFGIEESVDIIQLMDSAISVAEIKYPKQLAKRSRGIIHTLNLLSIDKQQEVSATQTSSKIITDEQPKRQRNTKIPARILAKTATGIREKKPEISTDANELNLGAHKRNLKQEHETEHPCASKILEETTRQITKIPARTLAKTDAQVKKTATVPEKNKHEINTNLNYERNLGARKRKLKEELETDHATQILSHAPSKTITDEDPQRKIMKIFPPKILSGKKTSQGKVIKCGSMVSDAKKHEEHKDANKLKLKASVKTMNDKYVQIEKGKHKIQVLNHLEDPIPRRMKPAKLSCHTTRTRTCLVG